jgi:hypothetical protein
MCRRLQDAAGAAHLEGPLQRGHLHEDLEVDLEGVDGGREDVHEHQLLQDVPRPQPCTQACSVPRRGTHQARDRDADSNAGCVLGRSGGACD